MRLLKELFEVHKELNPQLFEENKLKNEIRLRLVEIADMWGVEYTNITTTHGRALKNVQDLLNKK